MAIKTIMLLLATLFFISSCTNNQRKKAPFLKLSKDSVVISVSPDRQYDLLINIQNENVISFPITGKKSYSLLDLVKKYGDKKELALKALKNKNAVLIKIKVGEDIDTLVNYTVEPYYDEESFTSISGQCAPLISKLSNPTQSVDLKKWLFRKKVYLDDDQLHIFAGILNQLSKSKTREYVTNATMPVLHNFAGLKYNVHSNLEGDYFVLYACKSSKEIEEFVEDVVANGFELCSTSPSGLMTCYRNVNNSGYLCISLISIKKDWSYKIQPLGLVAIDNVVISKNVDDNIASINFPNNVKVILPSNKPQIFGTCSVTSASGGGNGIECNVSFYINHSGDIKSVTVKRTKKLCYDSWTHKVENRVVNVKEVDNPYSFTMMLHLVDGDNYIPVVIEDNHGNKTELELNERATFTRNNAPSINNNINIYD